MGTSTTTSPDLMYPFPTGTIPGAGPVSRLYIIITRDIEDKRPGCPSSTRQTSKCSRYLDNSHYFAKWQRKERTVSSATGPETKPRSTRIRASQSKIRTNIYLASTTITSKLPLVAGWSRKRSSLNRNRSETIPGTVPIGRTHPQHVKGGLYPDRLTGSPFTVPRSVNKQTHFYRTLPSTSASDYVEWKPNSKKHDLGLSNLTFKPNPYMYLPVEIDPSDDFVSGLRLLVGVGDPAMRKGVAYYIYAAGKDMNENQVFTTADGDLCLGRSKSGGVFIH